MAITVHTITRYTVQFLTKKAGEQAHSYATVRLYDDDNHCRGVAVFENYKGREPPKPTGDNDEQSATWYLDIAFFDPFMDVLRLEKENYLKIGWTQVGRLPAVAQVSIDTKKEIIGEFFDHPESPR